ncbi:MAG: SHOCT domain-containing protein [Clostridia bacterium]|nr:SHOCT domain-containing protein [Clostridia bacterium]
MKRILRGVSIVLAALGLILYLFAPIIEVLEEEINAIDYFEDADTPMIIATVVLLCVNILGSIIAFDSKTLTSSKVMAFIAGFTAVCCFSAKGFIVTDLEAGSLSSYFELGAGAIFSGLLLLVIMGLQLACVFVKEDNALTVEANSNAASSAANNNGAISGNIESTVAQDFGTTNTVIVDDKQNNLTRFLLTFFLGWIGSLVINNSTLKPRGYRSRTCAYIFLTILTFGIYGLVASICNLTFDPAKSENVGYFRDGTSLEVAKPVQPVQVVQTVHVEQPQQPTQPVQSQQSIQPSQADVDKQLEQLVVLKSLLDQGILTQEEFDAKKKQILGL